MQAKIYVGIDGKATSIEAFVDVENGRMTIIDNGEGITPETLKNVVSSSGITLFISRICLFPESAGFQEKSLFTKSGSCTRSIVVS